MSAFAPEDRPLIEQIYTKNEPALVRKAFRELGDEQSTEDAVQTAACRFMDAFDKITHTSERDLRGYLYKILLNVIADMQNRNPREILMAHVPRERTALDNVEEFVLGKQGMYLLYEKIDQLPPRYGLYLEMACIGKYPPDVIARALGVKKDSLRTIAYRAKKKLAELCSEESEVY